jgi:hypothetical protein
MFHQNKKFYQSDPSLGQFQEMLGKNGHNWRPPQSRAPDSAAQRQVMPSKKPIDKSGGDAETIHAHFISME